MKALFDTNILIDYLNGTESARDEFERHQQRLVSIVTWMEVLAGPRTAAEEDVVELFLRDFRIVELTRAVAREAAQLADAYLQTAGRAISLRLEVRGRVVYVWEQSREPTPTQRQTLYDCWYE